MKWTIISALAVLLVVSDLFLIVQNRQLKGLCAELADDTTEPVNPDDARPDMRGLFTYPGIGVKWFEDDSTKTFQPAPLTLIVFFSARTSCPSVLSETRILRRLLPTFQARGQAMYAVSTVEDSSAIAALLVTDSLDIPLSVFHSEDSMTLADMGISHYFMPFKILYDSTMTAVYIRGADNTPQSQTDFENAMLWLSEIYAERSAKVATAK